MKTRITVSAIVIFLLSVAFRSEEKGNLNVTLSNIKKTGKIKVGLYRSGEDFPSAKFKVKDLVVECIGSCKLEFPALPYGEYAVAIFQDVNGNDKLDTGVFGIPSEPFAFSNNFKPRFGGPTFEKCRFDFSKDNQTIQIHLINSLFGND